MSSATCRFYRELNDFLPRRRRQREFDVEFPPASTVKDAIERIGVPHTEVDLILVNGQSVDFDYPLREGDRISVYPVFEALEISSVTRLRPHPLRQSRFVLDCHLGRLARYLRMLGFDSLFRSDYHDDTLLQISIEQQRILLTRDLELLKRKQLQRGYYVRATRPRQQVTEVIRRLQLEKGIRPFSRCIACNGTLEKARKEEIRSLLPANTDRFFDEFIQCRDCLRVYWKGSHYERMQRLVKQFTGA
ncbi:Mut7-C RNAse domain-containing protein [Microbulbifer taiwanensis]|uniref:Mut7-C RNAse domain-containing protein n=1 Tax=Microbulbifer taiwanensis TaxID=986746 RepID=A0ABW1YU48_9GAMM|nr:Mut7-C RNAse domain-containing protein [Microbulbifer taiwanensis]